MSTILSACKMKFGAKPHANTVNPFASTTKEKDVPLEEIFVGGGAPHHMPKVVECELYRIVQGHRLHSLALTPWDLIDLAKIAIGGTPTGRLYKTEGGEWDGEKFRKWYIPFCKMYQLHVGTRRVLEAQRKKWCTSKNFLKSQIIWEDVHIAAEIAIGSPTTIKATRHHQGYF